MSFSSTAVLDGAGKHQLCYPCTWVLRREETGQDSLIVNFDTDLRSSFFAKLYQHSHLGGGHVVMLGSDQASRCLSLSYKAC